MNPITLIAKTPQGETLQATYLPEKGMNLISFKKGDVEIIDQSTQNLFDERFAGLGALIGPHFHHRRKEIIPHIADESLFPHIARVKAKGISEPFSHGIARYAPWKATTTENIIKATLTGKDKWNDIPLSILEGQNFTMHYQANLSFSGLTIDLDVVSETDSLVGIHYYYHLPQGTGKVISAIQPEYLSTEGKQPLKSNWKVDSQHLMTFDLNEEADYTFYPFPSPRESKITLDTGVYRLTTTYTCISQENCWQLYHPKGASFVCIEPISAQDPHHPNLTVSSIRIHLTIET